jgi:hypothetical protein
VDRFDNSFDAHWDLPVRLVPTNQPSKPLCTCITPRLQESVDNFMMSKFNVINHSERLPL